MLERMVSVLSIDPQLLQNVTNSSIGDVIEDFSNVFGRLVTQKNVKVSYLQLFCLVIAYFYP